MFINARVYFDEREVDDLLVVAGALEVAAKAEGGRPARSAASLVLELFEDFFVEYDEDSEPDILGNRELDLG